MGGAPAAVGYVVVATTGLVLAFQGLAVLHVRLRGHRFSAPILAVVYFVLGLLGWPLLLFALIGVADLFLNFRDPKVPPAPGPDETTASPPATKPD